MNIEEIGKAYHELRKAEIFLCINHQGFEKVIMNYSDVSMFFEELRKEITYEFMNKNLFNILIKFLEEIENETQ